MFALKKQGYTLDGILHSAHVPPYQGNAMHAVRTQCNNLAQTQGEC